MEREQDDGDDDDDDDDVRFFQRDGRTDCEAAVRTEECQRSFSPA